MKPSFKMTRLALLCAALVACSPFGWQAGHDTGAAAEQAYRAGRAHHLAQRPGPARAAYEAALRLEAAHPGARNGLATLHAEDRELAPAIAIWRELTAKVGLDAGPGKAYLFANLGQAYLLEGEHGQARAVLERACLLDPLNPRGWQLLGDVLAALGEDERAAQMRHQAAALRQYDLRADLAVVSGGKTDVVALDQAVSSPAPQAHPGWAQAYIHVGADGMMELRRTGSPPQELLPIPAALARLEIRNGNGVTGMARALSRRIDQPGVQVTRLSNAPGFAVRLTRIEYEAAHVEAARRLAERLGSAQLHQVDDCAPADLRLVLGRDLARQGVALRLTPLADGQRLAYR